MIRNIVETSIPNEHFIGDLSFQDSVAPTPVVKQAELVMESRGLAPQLRSVAISDSWSKLYRTDAHMVDMSFQADQGRMMLQGQLLEQNGWDVLEAGHIVLRDQHAGMIWSELSETGEFYFDVDEPGDYQLEASFGHMTIQITELSIN